MTKAPLSAKMIDMNTTQSLPNQFSAGWDEAQVRRAIAREEKPGEAEAEVEGNARWLKISSCVIDPTLTPVGSKLPVAQSLPLAVERIVRELKPEKIILFGSYAYGKPTPDSDVDLLIIMETDAQRKERYLSVSLLLAPRPFPVDILVKTPGEIRQAFEKGDFFIKEIVSQGKILYERHH